MLATYAYHEAIRLLTAILPHRPGPLKIKNWSSQCLFSGKPYPLLVVGRPALRWSACPGLCRLTGRATSIFTDAQNPATAKAHHALWTPLGLQGQVDCADCGRLRLPLARRYSCLSLRWSFSSLNIRATVTLSKSSFRAEVEPDRSFHVGFVDAVSGVEVVDTPVFRSSLLIPKIFF